MKSYQCHKIVQAGEILGVDPERNNVFFDNGGGVSMWTSPGLFARGAPDVGGYIVFYEGDYVSWSPKAVFEAGYSYIPPTDVPIVEPVAVAAAAAPAPAPVPAEHGNSAQAHQEAGVVTPKEVLAQIAQAVVNPHAAAPPAMMNGKSWVP